MEPFCYKLTLSYDGTGYSGWQIQPNALSIQELIQNALSTILREPISVIGSGRTDTGVHALAQIAHFKTERMIDCKRMLFSLNGLLPQGIRVKTIENAPLSFHAQRDAIGKEYHYHLHLNPVMSPFKRLYSWHITQPFDCERLKEGARLFVGTHDFTSFANESHKGAASSNPVRTIYSIKVEEEEGGIRLEFYGNGFLYKMVRNIVGALVQVACLKLTIKDLEEILAAKDRRKAPMAAAPQGLFLAKVDYN